MDNRYEAKKFLNDDLANDYFESLVGESLGFCPIANIACNSRCVCYTNPRVEENTKRISTMEVPQGEMLSEWTVYPPYCDNHMYWGE